jgi:hypothetical protein
MKNNNSPIRKSGSLLLRTIRKAMKELSHLKDLKSSFEDEHRSIKIHKLPRF